MNESLVTFLSLALYACALVLVTWGIYRDSVKREGRRADASNSSHEQNVPEPATRARCTPDARTEQR